MRSLIAYRRNTGPGGGAKFKRESRCGAKCQVSPGDTRLFARKADLVGGSVFVFFFFFSKTHLPLIKITAFFFLWTSNGSFLSVTISPGFTCDTFGRERNPIRVKSGRFAMAEGADCGSVIAAKRRQPPGRKSRLSQQKKNPSSRVRCG